MVKYRATIVSPKGKAPKTSEIEFDSDHRAGSKLNVQDARYKMLEIYGSEAVAWTVKDVERVRESEDSGISEQMMIDFRDPVQERKRRPRIKRGISG